MKFSHGSFYLILCVAILGCGKEHTLVIDEHWSTERMSFTQDTHFTILAEESYTSGSHFGLSLQFHSGLNKSDSVPTDWSFKVADFVLRTKNLTDRAPVSVVLDKNSFSTLNKHPIVVTTGDSKVIELGTLPDLIHGGSLPAINEKICYQTPTRATPIVWSPSNSSFISIETVSFQNDLTDVGYWQPAFDFLQSIFPNASMVSLPDKPEPQSRTILLTRERFESVDQIYIVFRTQSQFQTSVQFNCQN